MRPGVGGMGYFGVAGRRRMGLAMIQSVGSRRSETVRPRAWAWASFSILSMEM